MLRQPLQGEVDIVQYGIHVRNQNVLCADNTVTSLSHSQRVGEYLERKKERKRETLKALFHEVSLKRSSLIQQNKFQYHINMLNNFSRMW